jgi:hypothetical protein
VRLEERFLGAVGRERVANGAQGGEGNLVRELRAQLQRKVRHLLVGAGAARGPLPDLASAKAGLLAGGEALVK